MLEIAFDFNKLFVRVSTLLFALLALGLFLLHVGLSTLCTKFIYIFECFFFAITSPIFLQIAKAMLKKIDSYAQEITDSKCKAT